MQLVDIYLMPEVAGLGLRIVEAESTVHFDNASVVLLGGNVAVRIVRERSQLFVDFGKALSPRAWFDSAVMLELLGFSRDAGWHDEDPAQVLGGLARFLLAAWTDLNSRFAGPNAVNTEEELRRIRADQDARRFG